jgi:hypothetical protein
MAGVRIRWRGVARVAAIVVVGLLALRLVPDLLRAPEPPPLAANVGLPRAEPVRVAAKPRPGPLRREPEQIRHRREPGRRTRRHRKEPGRRARRHRGAHPRAVADEPGSTAVIGSRHRRRRKIVKPPRRHPETVAEPPVESTPAPTPPPVPEYVLPPPPEPTPELLPESSPPPPPPPGDGSEEFAPH